MRRRRPADPVIAWRATADRLIAEAPPFANWDYNAAWQTWADRLSAALDRLDDFAAREAFHAYVWDALGDVPLDPTRPVGI